jgi:hypothetical protein
MRPAVWLLAPKFVIAHIRSPVHIHRGNPPLGGIARPRIATGIDPEAEAPLVKVTIVDCRSQDLDIGALPVDARPDMHGCGVLRQGERS